MVTHIGIAVGFIGYCIAVFFLIIILARLWKNKIHGLKNVVLKLLPVVLVFIMAIFVYYAYYGWTSSGKFITALNIPVDIAQRTIEGALPKRWDSPVITSNYTTTKNPGQSSNQTVTKPVTPVLPSRLSFLNP